MPFSDVTGVLIETTATPGDWNMAVDEWLLEQAITHNALSVRIYRWEEPTLSLGHFQNWPVTVETLGLESLPGSSPESLSLKRWAELPVVRRLSGGGAILHDREVTYSIALPSMHQLASEPSRLYDLAHQVIEKILESQGINVEARGRAEVGKDNAFLCYSRGDARDLLVGEEKVVGSAQRRRKGAILQHGSVLMKKSQLGGYRGVCDFFPCEGGWEEVSMKIGAELGIKLGEMLSGRVESMQIMPAQRSQVESRLEKNRCCRIKIDE